MIYFYLKKLTQEGYENVGYNGILPVVINATINGGDLGQQDILAHPELMRASELELKLAWLPEEELPFVTFDIQSAPDGFAERLDDVYGLMQKVYEGAGNQFPKESIQKAIQMVSQKYSDATERVVACVRDIRFRNGGLSSVDFAINVDADLVYEDVFSYTSKRLEQHNAAYKQDDMYVIQNNVTLFQENCTDELFIEIPSREAILGGDVEWNKVIPKRSALCKPYSDVNAYSPKYKELGVAKHLIPLIEGNSENNYVGIQENEKRYFDALLGWVQNNVVLDFGEDTGVIDSLSQSYLMELANRLYVMHWSHNKSMPFDILDEIDGDDDSDSDSDSGTQSKYIYRYQEGEKVEIRNALLSLDSFLEDAIAKFGYKVLVESIVKLARWGTRKCTALAFDDLDRVFDLGTNSVKRSIGPVSDYSVQLVNGCQFTVKGMIKVNGVADTEVVPNPFRLPVGLALSKTLVNSKGESISVPVYVSMLDVVNGLKSGEITIDGVGLESSTASANTVVSIQDLLEDYTANTDEFLQDPFYRNDQLFELAAQFGTGQNHQNLNLMSLLSEAFKLPDLKSCFSKYDLTGPDELRDKLVKGEIFSSMEAFCVSVTKAILPVLTKANSELGDEFTLADVVRAWNNALNGFEGFSVWRKETEQMEVFQEETPVATAAPAAPVAPKVEKEVETDMPSVTMIKSIKPDAVFAKIVDSNGNRIGGYTKETTIRGNKKCSDLTFVDNEYLNTVDPSKIADVEQNVIKLVPMLVNNLLGVVQNSQSVIHAYFASEQTLKHYIIAINTVVKELR